LPDTWLLEGHLGRDLSSGPTESLQDEDRGVPDAREASVVPGISRTASAAPGISRKASVLGGVSGAASVGPGISMRARIARDVPARSVVVRRRAATPKRTKRESREDNG